MLRKNLIQKMDNTHRVLRMFFLDLGAGCMVVFSFSKLSIVQIHSSICILYFDFKMVLKRHHMSYRPIVSLEINLSILFPSSHTVFKGRHPKRKF